jgi:hypothetical protein|tara:strand:- start:213 stop:347 length:135 start_codon:yes stop_codon:yes gene_type:complete
LSAEFGINEVTISLGIGFFSGLSSGVIACYFAWRKQYAERKEEN